MRRNSLTASAKLTVAALVGMAAVHLITVLLVEGEYPLFALVIELPLLAVAAVAATGWRWAPAVAAGLSALFLLLTSAGSISRLTQPRDPAFLSVWLFLILALVAVIAGVRATVQNYRN